MDQPRSITVTLHGGPLDGMNSARPRLPDRHGLTLGGDEPHPGQRRRRISSDVWRR